MPTQDDYQNAIEEDAASVSVPGADKIFKTLPRREARITEVEKIVYQPDPNALVPLGEGYFQYKRFQMTPVGMVLPEDATDAELSEIGWALKDIDNAVSWWVGDWALHAMSQWNWTASQVAEEFQYTPETIETYAWICDGIAGSIRNRAVFFSHHRHVAKMDEQLQEAWLNYAAHFLQKKPRLKVAEFRSDILAVDTKDRDEKFNLIYEAISQNKRLSQMDGLQPPALLAPAGLPASVIRGKPKASKAWNALNDFVAGRRDLKPVEVQQEGRALIEWVQKLMEASE